MDCKTLGIRQLVHKLQSGTVTLIYPKVLADNLRPRLNPYTHDMGIVSESTHEMHIYKPWSAVKIQDLEYIKELSTLLTRQR